MFFRQDHFPVEGLKINEITWRINFTGRQNHPHVGDVICVVDSVGKSVLQGQVLMQTQSPSIKYLSPKFRFLTIIDPFPPATSSPIVLFRESVTCS